MPLASSSRTVADVAQQVKRQFGDESGTQISNDDIIRWVNDGQLEICRRGEVNKSTAITSSVANQTAYNFPSDSIVKVLGISYKGTPLENSSFEQIQQLPKIDYSNCPELWYEYDDSIYLYPIPNISNDEIKLFLIRAPTIVAATGDSLTIPDTHYNALIQYVLQQAYELDEDFSSAGVKSAQMESSMSDLMSTSSYQYYPVITDVDYYD